MTIGSPGPISVFGHFAKRSGALGKLGALLLGVVAVVEADADDLPGTLDRQHAPTLTRRPGTGTPRAGLTRSPSYSSSPG